MRKRLTRDRDQQQNNRMGYRYDGREGLEGSKGNVKGDDGRKKNLIGREHHTAA
jgi:hypothetical protein